LVKPQECVCSFLDVKATHGEAGQTGVPLRDFAGSKAYHEIGFEQKAELGARVS